MKPHYVRLRNSDFNATFSDRFESLVLSVIMEETLLTDNMIFLLYQNARKIKPSDYPELSRTSIIEYVKLLQDKGFLKLFSGYELRNALKLPR